MDEIIRVVNTLLRREFEDRPMTCTLATATATGRATARTMVARELSAEGGLLFVSDRRTRKDDDLRVRPLCEVCFWLPKLNTQVRIQGQAVVIDALNDHGTRDAWWDRMDDRSVLIFSGQRGSPDQVPMPMTFELITVTPSWVTIDDYAETPPTYQTWGTRS
ncbi:MAG TPA: pyridoxamine 5'-phosphate oxidase family protein [Tepidisphaeraceae bacterium]|nr:pyridoxamine 5'-phosphate oxidase family protein [Tepidisphaeraceae bacterium]